MHAMSFCIPRCLFFAMALLFVHSQSLAESASVNARQEVFTVASSEPSVQQVDINVANSEQLAELLPGIGPAKAQRIIEWRRQNGSFTTIEQLQEVKGIGPKTVEKLRPLVRLGSSSATSDAQRLFDDLETQVQSGVSSIVRAATLAATPEAINAIAVRPWYKKSAMELLRAH